MSNRCTITKAVIPVAGLGTRFLPATKATPKEMLPVVDKPAIQYVVEEAVAAGINDVLFVTGRNKDSLENHFDRSPSLERTLAERGAFEMQSKISELAELAAMHYVRQGAPKGLGHAVSMAKEHVGNQAFAVLLGDDLVDERTPVLQDMFAAQAKFGGSILALMEVPEDQIHLYGCAAVVPTDNPDIVRVTELVEKPAAGTAPSNLAVIGRYVIDPAIFGLLENLAPGRGGEIQLTDALADLIDLPVESGGGVHAVIFRGKRYDTGDKLSYLKSVISIALDRDDLGPDLRAWLSSYMTGKKLMRSVEQHLEAVLANVMPLESLEVGLLGSVGCVLAEKVTTDDDGTEHVLLPQGTAIGARHVALLAAANLGRIWVHPKPRVVILTVGSDLADPGTLEELRPDINGIALTTASTAAGAMTFRVGPLQSDADLIRSAIEDQLVRADVIIAACGMNAGDYDLLTSVLRELGRVEISRVNMTPGGAQGFGVIGPDSTPIFVLPGNPVGALLSFEVFVSPLIRRLMGHSKLHHRVIEARLETTVDGAGDDARYVRAHVSRSGKEPVVKSLENHNDHPLAGLGTADALIVVPAGTSRLNAGDTVRVMQLDALSDD